MAANWKPGNTRKAVSDEERRVAAYKDWLQGASGPMLVEKYGYSDRHAAIRAVRLVQRSLIEDAAEAREQATARMMEPLMAMRELALQGDAQAAGAHKNYEAEIAKLHGIYAPVKTDVTSAGEGITIQVVPDWKHEE